MKRKAILFWLCLLAAPALPSAPRAWGQAPGVAVFNFQMKSQTPEWAWLEKFLSDQITTDFFRAGRQVVARDEMQLLAQETSWVPEMATGDANAVGRIQAALKIEHLVTGTCSVEGEEIAIAGHVVRMSNRKEVFRHEVKGKISEVLSLQKKLSSELLAWFTQGKADQILEKLPVWTRSIPAVKALYQGMDLYDQGRYAEAWLRFRQASREDKDYVEALYWVGKMYYFMERYDHARRELEKFVYQAPFHPRTGDALTEYVHSFEATGSSTDNLLSLYQYVRDRHPNVKAAQPMGAPKVPDMDEWGRDRAADLLERTGRYQESVLSRLPGDAQGLLDAVALNALTGRVIPKAGLLGTPEPQEGVHEAVFLTTDKTDVELPTVRPMPISGKVGQSLRQRFLLAAPSGYGIKGVRLYPLLDGDDAVVQLCLGWPQTDVFVDGQIEEKDAAHAKKEGVALTGLTPAGYLKLLWNVGPKGAGSREAMVKGIRIVAELEKIDRHGAVDILCRTTPCFYVDIDGRPVRCFPGLIGPLREGSHSVHCKPLMGSGVFGEWTGTVTVRRGQTTKLEFDLPWKKEPGWESWSSRVISREAPAMDVGRGYGEKSAPVVLVDRNAIRVLWSDGQDLWSSSSTDGNHFSEPARLDVPVSTAWQECWPRCIVDESGRYVLTFVSNREPRHLFKLYSCWSRDFVHWSAPAVLPIGQSRLYDLIQDRQGRYILATANMTSYPSDWKVSLDASPDLSAWKPLGSFSWPARSGPNGIGYIEMRSFQLTQRETGRYEAYFLMKLWQDANGMVETVAQASSDDGASWSELKSIWRLPVRPGLKLSHIALVRGRAPQTIAMFFTSTDSPVNFATFVTQKPDGQWVMSQGAFGLTYGFASACHDPRWGTLLAWAPEGEMWKTIPHLAHAGDGPVVVRGRDLERALPKLADVIPPPPLVIAPYPKAVKPPAVELAEGCLRFVPFVGPKNDDPFSPKVNEEWVRVEYQAVEGAAPSAPKGCGTVHPSALAVNCRVADSNFSFALDCADPNGRDLDLARVDPTGSCRFRDANLFPGKVLMHLVDSGAWAANYHGLINVRAGKLTVPVDLECEYIDGKNSLIQGLAFQCRPLVYLEGRCRFGGDVYNVIFANTKGDLGFERKPEILLKNGRIEGYHQGDWRYVYSGKRMSDELGRGSPGGLVQVNGKLYTLRLSEDRAKVSAEPYTGPTGRIHIDQPRWKALWISKDRVQCLCGGREPVSVPVGEYVIFLHHQWASEKAARGEFPFTSGSEYYFYDETVEAANRPANRVTVKEGQTTEVATVGSPYQAEVVVKGKSPAFSFEIPQWRDAGGRLVEWRSGRPVRFEIVDSGGKAVDSLSVEGARCTWKVPANLHGTYGVRASLEVGVKVEVKPATIQIE